LAQLADAVPVGSTPQLVLAVDDEPVVLGVLLAVLRRAGFEALGAESSAQALEIVASRQGAIDLVVADVILPGLHGPAMADLIAEKHPEMRFLFIAGLADSIEIRESILARGLRLLAKPFFPREFIAEVRSALEEPVCLTAAVGTGAGRPVRKTAPTYSSHV
jgi:two-component system, cell cycle sensor histidine kinase and response regulator CckA